MFKTRIYSMQIKYFPLTWILISRVQNQLKRKTSCFLAFRSALL